MQPTPIKTHIEPIGNQCGIYHEILEKIDTAESPFQKAEVITTKSFKKTLLLDGYIQVGEEGDFFYHEPMSHLPLLAHSNPKNILIVGGGDGGIAKEVLRHNCVQSVHLCEIDTLSIDMSKKYFPNIHENCWDDPKFSLFLEDGKTFIQKQQKKYDVVISDMTDPFGPSAQLYTQEFFQMVKESFAESSKGIFCMHAETPITRSALFASILKTLESKFCYVIPFYVYIQMYGTMFCIAVSSDDPDICNISSQQVTSLLQKRNVKNLQILTGDTYVGLRSEYPIFSQHRKQKGIIITQKNCENLLEME